MNLSKTKLHVFDMEFEYFNIKAGVPTTKNDTKKSFDIMKTIMVKLWR